MAVLRARHFDGPRQPQAGEGAAVLALLSRVFSWKSIPGWTMLREYPHLYGDMEGHRAWAHVIAHQGRIVAHVGVYPLRFVVPGGTVRVGGIGAVATDPRFRGQGLMARLLEHASGWMRANGMPLSILWGDTLRYARFGWVPAGESLEFGVDATMAKARLGAYALRAAELAAPERHADELHGLQRRLPLRVERSPEVFRQVLRKWRRRVLAAWDGRRIVAYAIAQVWANDHGGRDWRLEDLAGTGPGQLSLIRWLACRPGTGRVRGELAPGFSPAAARILDAAEGWTTRIHPIGQLKVVDEAALLRRYGAGGLASAVRRAEPAANRRTRLLFGPARPAMVVPPGPLRQRLSAALPLPLFLSHADHV